ncbi:site-specific integrase [Fictibacillus enclensis]|uniref:tyrosine-type recombinase/integrase n=1 Tax=Fictibacillus enclensis TaxID=1017270 RepID=UPI0025A230BB|nr:site-specific integrase [Fictibacillus enclensis]MDM5198952.1 site-specific integrase [Fictibacillus enclensis]
MFPLIDSLPNYSAVYLEALEKKGRQGSTIRRYFYDVSDFLAWMRVVKKEDSFSAFQSLQTRDFQLYFDFLMNERHYSLRTLQRVLTVLKQLVQFQIGLGNLSFNPVNGVQIGPKDDPFFTEEDFITNEELQRLFETVRSYEGLTENQQKYRHMLIDRNQSIITLLAYYGLTLHELTSLRMKHINFTKGYVHVPSETSLTRDIPLEKNDQMLLYSYYETIPQAVRPAWYSNDHFLAAFDYQRGTYRWVYKTRSPKPLTEIAVQKMIRLEIQRSGLRKGISAQHLRRTCILNDVKAGLDLEIMKTKYGFKSPLSLRRYYDYLQAIPT